MTRRLVSLLLLHASFLLGCAANQEWINADPAQRKAMFERTWNARVGSYIDLERIYKNVVVSVTEVGAGKREYVVRQLAECRIALTVDKEAGTLLSWRYVSEQPKCAAHYYSPGA